MAFPPNTRGRSPLTLDDLVGDLVWPRLLRAGRMALRPARVGLGAFYIVGAIILLKLAKRIDGAPGRDVLSEHGVRLGGTIREFFAALAGGDWDSASSRLVHIFRGAPAALVKEAPWVAAVILPALLAWTVIMGGAIARTAATELAWSRSTSWPEALGEALRRWKSLVGAVVIPLAVIALINLIMQVSGMVLFGVPYLGLIGALGWGLFVIGGLIAAIVMIGFALGWPMLVPAVVSEGTDAIDAVQHAYAMSFAKPVRLVGYMAVLLLQGLLLGVVVTVVLGSAMLMAQYAGRGWSGERGQTIIGPAVFVSLADSSSPPPATDLASASLVHRWNTVFIAMGFGAAVSYFWCAATALFLVMRRVCDGQEISDIWAPGMVGGTTSESLQSRGSGARDSGVVVGGPPGGASQAIVDNGPADEG